MSPRKNKSSSPGNRVPTLADVAAEVGVTAATVSYVINGRQTKRISEETRKKILAAARRLKYVPNYRARSLVTGYTSTIAAYSSQPMEHAFRDNYSQKLLRGILQKCVMADYALELLIEGHRLQQFPVDGWISLMPREELDAEETKGKPVVYVDPIKSISAHDLFANHREAAMILARHIRSTAKKVLFVNTSENSATFHTQRERYSWLQAGLEDAASLNAFRPKVEKDISSIAALAAAAAQEKEYDTIVAATDELGVCIISELQGLGIKVPEQIQVAAFDNTGFAHITHPKLTIVDLGTEELGYRAVSVLLKLIHKEFQAPNNLLDGPPQPVLIKGQSTR